MGKKHRPLSYYKYKSRHANVTVCINKQLKPLLDELRKKVFLFNLKSGYKKYINLGKIEDNLIKLFNKKNISLTNNASIKKINDKKWIINDGKNEYKIIDTGKLLKVYEKMSYARFIRHILDKNTEYLKKHHQEYIKGFKEGIEKYGIWYNCNLCNKRIWIEPNTEVHKQIIEFLKERGWGHAACHQSSRQA